MDNSKVHIKKFPHNEEFLQKRFLPFKEDYPEYKAYLFTYRSDRYKLLLVPSELEVYFDKEKYYYAKDANDPSIVWGYVKYDYFPATNANCDNYAPCSSQGRWNCYKNEYFSTKYFPDLKPYIPKSAIEKH